MPPESVEEMEQQQQSGYYCPYCERDLEVSLAKVQRDGRHEWYECPRHGLLSLGFLVTREGMRLDGTWGGPLKEGGG